METVFGMTTQSSLKRSYRLILDIPRFRFIHRSECHDAEFVLQASLPEEVSELCCFQNETNESLALRKDATKQSNSCEVVLKGDAFAMDFHCGPFDCATVFSKDPRIAIEMLSKSYTGNQITAIASVSLGALSQSEQFETWITLFRIHSEGDSIRHSNEEIGEILVSVILKDLGLASPSPSSSTENKPSKQSVDEASKDSERIKWKKVQKAMENEFELWRREQIAKHERILHEMEMERMQFLEDEWRRHEHQREKEINALKSELQIQTDKALVSIKDVEEREKKVVVLQESLIRRRKELERQHALRIQETEDVIARLQKDCEHHLTLEKEKTNDLLSKIGKLKQSIATAERTIQNLENEKAQLKKLNVQSTVVMLEQELEGFKKINATSQERIVVLEKEKEQYKKKVVELADQMAALQTSFSKPNEVITESLSKSIETNQNTNNELVALRNELERLKMKTQNQQKTEPETKSQQNTLTFDLTHEESTSLSNEILQILQNREELLKTGVYKEGDALILQLDDRIRALSDRSELQK